MFFSFTIIVATCLCFDCGGRFFGEVFWFQMSERDWLRFVVSETFRENFVYSRETYRDKMRIAFDNRTGTNRKTVMRTTETWKLCSSPEVVSAEEVFGNYSSEAAIASNKTEFQSLLLWNSRKIGKNSLEWGNVEALMMTGKLSGDVDRNGLMEKLFKYDFSQSVSTDKITKLEQMVESHHIHHFIATNASS